MTVEQFAQLFHKLAISKGLKVDEDVLELWYNELKTFPDEAIIKGFKDYTRDCETRLIFGKMLDSVQTHLGEIKALPRPPITPEEREKNCKRLRAIVDMLDERTAV